LTLRRNNQRALTALPGVALSYSTMRTWCGVLLMVMGLARTTAAMEPTADQHPAVVAASNGFGFRLLQSLKAGQAGNIIVSPVSLAMALAMTQNGAAGGTRAAIAKTLGVAAMSASEMNRANRQLLQLLGHADPSVQLDIANALWLQSGFAIEPDFVRVNRESYDAEVRNVDFQGHPDAAAQDVNDWTTLRTHRRIAKIIEPDSRLRFVVTDAVYFKGRWTEPFDKKETRPRRFYPLNRGPADIAMMRQTGEYHYFADVELQAIRLSYGNSRFVMYIFLPRPPLGRLARFVERLTTQRWSDWTTKLAASEEQRGEIVLPRFERRWGQKLNDELIRMGMGIAFGSEADFSRAHQPPPPLQLSFVIQKTFMKVDEEGTEATAASAVGAVATSMAAPRGEPFEMIVDHPFFCAVTEQQTGAVLFAGAITNPAAE